MRVFLAKLAWGFYDLLRESVIVQGLITLTVIGTISYLAITGQPIPDILQSFGGLIVGFYFGSKLALAKARS